VPSYIRLQAILADVEYAESIGDPCCVASGHSEMARAALAKAKEAGVST